MRGLQGRLECRNIIRRPLAKEHHFDKFNMWLTEPKRCGAAARKCRASGWKGGWKRCGIGYSIKPSRKRLWGDLSSQPSRVDRICPCAYGLTGRSLGEASVCCTASKASQESERGPGEAFKASTFGTNQSWSRGGLPFQIPDSGPPGQVSVS